MDLSARVSRGRRQHRQAALFVLPLVLVAIWLLAPVRYIEVWDRQTGETYFVQRAQEGDAVRLSWIHSIEHTPWVEVYRVSGGRLMLEEARVKSFGAGVDQIAPEVATEDGWVILRGTGRVFRSLHFIYSREVDHELRIGGRELELEERVPHHAAIRVGVKQGPRVLWWTRKM